MQYIFCGFSLFWFQRHSNISGKLLQLFRLNVFRSFFSLSFFSKLSLLLIEPQQVNSLPVVTVSSSHCLLNIVHLSNALHWVSLTTSRSLCIKINGMNVESFGKNEHPLKTSSFLCFFLLVLSGTQYM